MINLNSRLRRVLTSIFDPLVTSGTMFLVQGAVLVSVNKIEFASYSLAYSYVTMGQAVLSALFGGPLLTLLGSLGHEDARGKVGLAILRLQLAIGLGVAVLGCGAAVALGVPAGLAGLAALSMVGLSFRDAVRSVLAATLEFEAALVIALGFAGVTILSLVGLFLSKGLITAESGLAALAIGALGMLAPSIVRALTCHASPPRSALRRLMGMAVWSVPGAAVIWLQNSFYLTLVALNLSLAAVGEVSAARMIAMPILITASGLMRLTQVQASRKLVNDGAEEAIRNAGRLAIGSLALGAFVAALFWMADGIADPRWLPNSYPHLLPLAGMWLAFAATTTARGFYSSLFQAMGRYREIFVLNVVILPFVLGGVAIGPRLLGLPGAVLPMVVGELALLALLAARSRSPSVSLEERQL